jgi:hypothetical protein
VPATVSEILQSGPTTDSANADSSVTNTAMSATTNTTQTTSIIHQYPFVPYQYPMGPPVVAAPNYYGSVPYMPYNSPYMGYPAASAGYMQTVYPELYPQPMMQYRVYVPPAPTPNLLPQLAAWASAAPVDIVVCATETFFSSLQYSEAASSDPTPQNNNEQKQQQVWLAWSFQANFIYKPVL